jgi:hypothetical protein
MNMKNITKRDLRTFLLGMLTMFLLVIAYDWNDFVSGFMDGSKGLRSEVIK